MAEQALVSVHDYNPLALMPRNAAEAKVLATELASSSLIPTHLQKKPGDCLMIVMQAHRWQMDPFVVAQCTSLVHGKMCYEGKLVAAALTTMNAIEGRLSYDIRKLDGGDMEITVTGTPRGGKEQSITGTVLGWRTYEYKKNQQGQRTNEKQPNNWDKDPTSMLVYRGTRQWARLFAPEALLGVYTPDELDDAPATVEATVISTTVPQKAAAKEVIEDAVVTEPKKATPTTAAKPAAQQQSPASQQQPSSPPPQEQPTTPAENLDQAAATSGEDLPFGDPAETQQQPSTASDYPAGMRPGPNGPGSPATPREAADTGDAGIALSDTQMRIVKSRQQVVNVSDADLAAKFPSIGKGNINKVLEWLESKRQKTA